MNSARVRRTDGKWPTEYDVPLMRDEKFQVHRYRRQSVRVFRYERTLSEEESLRYARIVFREISGRIVSVDDASGMTDVSDVRTEADLFGGTSLVVRRDYRETTDNYAFGWCGGVPPPEMKASPES